MSTLRPDLVLDDADLALLECNIDDAIEDPTIRQLVARLVEEIRWYRDENEHCRKSLEDAKDEAKDAGIALDKVRTYLTDAPIEADRYADEAADHLDNIGGLNA